MTERTKQRLDALAGSSIFILACIALAYAMVMMAGCAGGSTSEITPAESSAAEKSYRLTGETAKKQKTRIVFRKVGGAVVGDEGEDK